MIAYRLVVVMVVVVVRGGVFPISLMLIETMSEKESRTDVSIA